MSAAAARLLFFGRPVVGTFTLPRPPVHGSGYEASTKTLPRYRHNE